MAEIGVIGSGSWGTALALVLNKNGHHVTIWSYLKEEADEIRKKRENPSKLPGVHIPEEIEITTDLQGSVEGKDVVVLAVPSMATRATAKKMCPYVKEEQILVNVAKGIEEGTLKTLSEQIEEEIPQANVAVLSGPSHAEEVSRELPTTVVVGAETEETAIYLQKIFMNDVFRVYTSPDIKGIELGGSLKNVIALAAGVADGLGYGDNTKAALITRGIAEITRLGVKMGGKLESFTGLTGIGDLIVTCASKHSRNRKAGVLIGEGMTMEEAMAEVKMVVECRRKILCCFRERSGCLLSKRSYRFIYGYHRTRRRNPFGISTGNPSACNEFSNEEPDHQRTVRCSSGNGGKGEKWFFDYSRYGTGAGKGCLCSSGTAGQSFECRV